jgi:MGT family glycosyltransferase
VARIVLNPFGSLGDVHPYLALAIGLRERGHQPIIATAESYRSKMESEGIGFSPVRPDVGELLENPELLRKIWHPRWGSEYLLREYVLPQIERGYEDLLGACQGADLVLTHCIGYAGPIAAEVLKLPWISVALQPAVFVSAYDPPVLAPAPFLRHLSRFGRFPLAAVLAIGKRRVRAWGEPIARLRRRAGLPASKADPILAGQFSRFGTLALFSRYFAQPQPDWPPKVCVTGFVFYDREMPGEAMEPELAQFLEQGPPPIVFTLGSSAVLQAGTFYEESLAAALDLGVRAVLLVGRVEHQQLSRGLPPSIYVTKYAPYSELLPKAAAVVHQGGIGTTAQALRAGHPMLVVPWAHDQPDNAERTRKLGLARVIPRSRYSRKRGARELQLLLDRQDYGTRAREIAEKVAAEDGVAAACEEVEALLGKNRVSAVFR